MDVFEEFKEKYGVDLSELGREIRDRNEAWRDLAKVLNEIGKMMVEYRLFSMVDLSNGRKLRFIKKGEIVRLEIVTPVIIDNNLGETIHLRIDVHVSKTPKIFHIEGSPPDKYTLREIVYALNKIIQSRVEI